MKTSARTATSLEAQKENSHTVIERLQSLQARLTRDGIVTALPLPTTVSILLDIASVRFIVTWSDAGVVLKTTVSDADRWDFGFTVPESAWNEFAKPEPGPLNNTAQAIVAQFAQDIVSGDKVKWAQYTPFLERILFCLKPGHRSPASAQECDQGDIPNDRLQRSGISHLLRRGRQWYPDGLPAHEWLALPPVQVHARRSGVASRLPDDRL